MDIWQYKRDCHRLMDETWGTEKKGKGDAYLWLEKEFGISIHFSKINDLELLQKVHGRLLSHFVFSVSENLFTKAIRDPKNTKHPFLNNRMKNRKNHWKLRKETREKSQNLN